MSNRIVGGDGEETPPLTRPSAGILVGSFRDDDLPTGPKSGSKVVSISDTPEQISPTIPSLESQPPPKQFSAGLGRRLSGRPPSLISSSRGSLVNQSGMDELPAPAMQPPEKSERHLLKQVSEWLHAEKAKRHAKKEKKRDGATIAPARSRAGSDDSLLSLEKLQKILEETMASTGLDSTSNPASNSRPRLGPHGLRKSSSRIMHRTASSDTEHYDGDVTVPNCDVVLDNSKTMSYSGGAATASSSDLAATSKRAEKERKAWVAFKNEIVKLAHTLRLKGWRRVPLDAGDDIKVERLSGALTNAVYVVSPPENLHIARNTDGQSVSRKAPPKLLLRIYGPQVEHLIDRENELGILRRLARQKIGPRLLGTFRNGRFEEYFASTTLTASDLRVPATSKQIAKRMRELHDGIELLEQEREDGPFVLRNWDKWVDRCEYVIKYLDDQILSGKAGQAENKSEKWKQNGLVCGVEWKFFRGMIDKYRKWLTEHYGGEDRIKELLTFAHNDTQYGNILRLTPSGESPLLIAANSHKQLVVIDFEYASANTPGLEFANHFTEWCYNYHDEKAPHVCNHTKYPTPEEQRRFVRSYVEHRPQFNAKASASATPKIGAASASMSSISAFMLDSRTPSGATPVGYDAEEEKRVKAVEERVEELVAEARIWRIANSAQWVAWGIVQAQVPGLDEQSDDTVSSTPASSEESELVTRHEHPASPDKRPEGVVAETLLSGGDLNVAQKMEAADAHEKEGEGEEEFDYLGYARERALFFWGDCLGLGLCTEAELEGWKKGLIGEVKVLGY